MPYPLTHLYTAEKRFGKLNRGIKLGSIAPDMISVALIPFSHDAFGEGHTTLKGLKNKDFEKAYNYHIKVDYFTEHKYFNNLTSGDHAFVEAGFDYLLRKNGIYYREPHLDKELIRELEDYFDRNLIFEKAAEFMIRWKKGTYIDCLVRTLRTKSIRKLKVLTDKDIMEQIKYYADLIEDRYKDYKVILNDTIRNAKYLELKSKRDPLRKDLSAW